MAWALFSILSFLQGIDAFGANIPSNDFQVATLNGGVTANLTDTLSAQLLFSSQYAFTTLPPPVLGFYGGEVFGRAYDPGALAGNSLATAALQIGQHIDTGLPWLSDLNLFAFADYGAAWNPAGSPYEFASLGSAGAGVRAAIGDNLVVTALVAQPLYYESPARRLGDRTKHALALLAQSSILPSALRKNPCLVCRRYSRVWLLQCLSPSARDRRRWLSPASPSRHGRPAATCRTPNVPACRCRSTTPTPTAPRSRSASAARPPSIPPSARACC